MITTYHKEKPERDFLALSINPSSRVESGSNLTQRIQNKCTLDTFIFLFMEDPCVHERITEVLLHVAMLLFYSFTFIMITLNSLMRSIRGNVFEHPSIVNS
jgi:hypothetical protein